MKVLMSGNEAIARGAYECGVSCAFGYPGTPSTEIMEEFSKYDGVYAEWSPNEKVAFESGLGAALAGARSMIVMKHVGVNVAADPLLTSSYTGVKGGLVIVTADDPSMHSSQNEQDNRNYARFAKIPMLEPSDSMEAKEFIKLAFEISEKFDTPVFLRSTTRVSHSKAIVDIEEKPSIPEIKTDITFNADKYVMVPARARVRRVEIETRTKMLKEFAESFSKNFIELNDTSVGFIASGMPYNYTKDVYPQYSYLKLGMVYPLPEKTIRAFAAKVDKLYVVEELDPFFEEQIKAMGINIIGKEVFPSIGEFDPGIVENAITGKLQELSIDSIEIPDRPPNLCPGCPHRGLFYALRRHKTFVTGDIGCYTLSFMKPLEGLHSCICMGASIGMAHGMNKALKEKGKGKVVGIIGDSTFIHSGITGLLNMVYNKSNAVVIILDNRTTAMTGMQEHPATGFTLQGEPAKELDFEKLASALGVENVAVVNPFELKKTEKVLKKELENDGPSLVISKAPCVLHKSQRGLSRTPLYVDIDKCNGCKACLKLGCPAITWKSFKDMTEIKVEKKTKKQEGIACIDRTLCTGCTLCQQLCKVEAIKEVTENE